MNRIQVKSSNLRSVGYDQSSAIIEVEFRRGGIYQYFEVPASRYAGPLSASSHGSYFARFIKDGGFSYWHIR